MTVLTNKDRVVKQQGTATNQNVYQAHQLPLFNTSIQPQGNTIQYNINALNHLDLASAICINVMSSLQEAALSREESSSERDCGSRTADSLCGVFGEAR